MTLYHFYISLYEVKDLFRSKTRITTVSSIFYPSYLSTLVDELQLNIKANEEFLLNNVLLIFDFHSDFNFKAIHLSKDILNTV